MSRHLPAYLHHSEGLWRGPLVGSSDDAFLGHGLLRCANAALKSPGSEIGVLPPAKQCPVDRPELTVHWEGAHPVLHLRHAMTQPQIGVVKPLAKRFQQISWPPCCFQDAQKKQNKKNTCDGASKRTTGLVAAFGDPNAVRPKHTKHISSPTQSNIQTLTKHQSN